MRKQRWESPAAKALKVTVPPPALPTPSTTSIPTLLYFTAKWCGPCKSFKPTLIAWAAARGLATKLKTVDVDSVEGSALADHWKIRSMPTVLFVANAADAAAPLAKVVGNAEWEQLDAALRRARGKE